MPVDFTFLQGGYSPPPATACDFDGALSQGNGWAGQSTLSCSISQPELLLIPWTGASGLSLAPAAILSDSFLLGIGEGRLGLSASGMLAPSWYIRHPLVGGARGNTRGGLGIEWSPQQCLDLRLRVPHYQATHKDPPVEIGWDELETLAIPIGSAWGQIPKLDREAAYPYGDLQHHPEAAKAIDYSHPDPKQRERLAIPWGAEITARETSTASGYCSPAVKDEAVAIPWDSLDGLDRRADLLWTSPPPKDRDIPIISGPYWYPRWCIRTYNAPRGDQLIFDFPVAVYVPPRGDQLIFDYDDLNDDLICHDGTWNGPKDAYWYQPHEWDIPQPVIRSYYIQMNTVTLKRVSDNVPIPILTMEIGTDRDSWCWTLRAALRRSVDLDLVRPSAGAPVEVEATINGNIWRFVIEEYGDERSHGQRSYSISGRSLCAYLATPYSDPSSLLQTSQLTAAQLVDQALLDTGFTSDFRLTDWLVPAGVYSVTNATPMQQLLTLAGAAGGAVYGDPSATTISLVPWYPSMPWEWGAVTVDAVLPTFQTRRSSYQGSTQYSGVYVSGQTQGVTCFVKRTGTDGSRQPQMHTDALITATEAGLAMGKKLLADSGPRSTESITAPLLDNPGLLTPGMLIEVTDPAGNWRGQVIRTSISAQRPTVTQSIDVLRYQGT